MEQFKLLPRITPIEISHDIISCEFQDSKHIGEKWIGCIITGVPEFIWGRFLKVEKHKGVCEFQFDKKDDFDKVLTNSEYWYLDGYWGERAELVFNNNYKWEKKLFEKYDCLNFDNKMRQLKSDEERIKYKDNLVQNGWDHEHCEICLESILENNVPGFRNEENMWVCINCYENYLEKKDLGFIYF